MTGSPPGHLPLAPSCISPTATARRRACGPAASAATSWRGATCCTWGCCRRAWGRPAWPRDGRVSSPAAAGARSTPCGPGSRRAPPVRPGVPPGRDRPLVRARSLRPAATPADTRPARHPRPGPALPGRHRPPPDHPNFHGLGQLRPAELAALHPGRQPLGVPQLAYARAAWAACRAPDPKALTAFAGEASRHCRSCRRHCAGCCRNTRSRARACRAPSGRSWKPLPRAR